jgi:hypothetical protein
VFLKTTQIIGLLIVAGIPCRADFSFLITERVTGGLFAKMALVLDSASRYYWQGQKMAIDQKGTTSIIDFGTRTVTSVDPASRTYRVRKLLGSNDPNGIQPTGAADYFARVETVGCTDQVQHGGALHVEEATAQEAPAHIPGVRIRRVRARMHIGDYEFGRRLGSLPEHDARQADGAEYRGENVYWSHSVSSWARWLNSVKRQKRTIVSNRVQCVKTRSFIEREKRRYSRISVARLVHSANLVPPIRWDH